MDMSDDKYSDENNQIDKNDSEKETNYIQVLKLQKFGLQKKTDDVERESDGINRMDIIDDKESDERYHIGESKGDDLESE